MEGRFHSGLSPASVAMGRYADGEDAAFDAVFDALDDRLQRFLTRMCRDPNLAEDLVQQTFLNMHLARGRFRPGAAVEPWAFAIARRLFLDHQRRARNAPHAELLDEAVDAGPSGEELVLALELRDQLSARLEALPPLLREAFLLVRESGLSVAEVAEVLETTVAAVKLRTHRAVKALRLEIADQPEEGQGE